MIVLTALNEVVVITIFISPENTVILLLLILQRILFETKRIFKCLRKSLFV